MKLFPPKPHRPLCVDWMSDQAFVGWVKGLIASSIAGGGGAIIGTGRVAYALAAGANNNVNPGGGWPTGISRLILTAPSGVANMTGLLAGTDGQWVLIQNDDGANNVTLNNENGGSVAANQFTYAADLILPPESTAIVVYDLIQAKWIIR